MERKNFIRVDEDFVCDHCQAAVIGSGYTNHCPQCLWSKHVDDIPGDRGSNCGGLMEPIGVKSKNDEYQILHKCMKCGHLKPNKVSPNDNRDILLSLPAV